jgi:hypothetical protein
MLEDVLWRFMERDGVEPTNEFAGHNPALRRLIEKVLLRLPPKGSRFMEWGLTVVQTCRLQGRNVL